MSGVRKTFRKQLSLSSGVLDLIMKSWSEGTAKQYVPHLRRWFSFCFNADVTSGAEFLTQHFRKSSYEYSSVNTAHSAFSSVLPSVNGFTSGEQPLIKRLLRGIFKERSTFPRYTVTCDVMYVLSKSMLICYIKKCSSSSETSLELTSKILATMMCLISGQKSQTLVYLSITVCTSIIQGVSVTSKISSAANRV